MQDDLNYRFRGKENKDTHRHDIFESVVLSYIQRQFGDGEYGMDIPREFNPAYNAKMT